MKFEEMKLSPELVEAAGFEEPTKIQEVTIPKILEGMNLIGQAPTGTGKTLAYLLPIFQMIDSSNSNVQALILSPTYELVMQTARVSQELSTKVDQQLNTLGLIGGANINRQIESLKKKKPQIISASPGRILELSRKNKLHFANLRFLVIDEFDRLLDDQNYSTIKEVLKLLPKKIQMLMFSATITKKAMNRSEEIGQFELFKVTDDLKFSAPNENYYSIVNYRDKIAEVRKLTRKLLINRGLVFVNSNFSATNALEKLRHDGIKVESLIGNANKMDRKQAIEKFKSGKCQLLLSTDLAARGLDISEIDYVINIDFPEDAKVYLHRAGRTGRAGAVGKVITLVDHKEVDKLKDFEKALSIKFMEI